MFYALYMHAIVFQLALINSALSAGVPPTWVTSPYIQANTRSLITNKTGNLSTPTATFPFTQAFPTIPNIGYGIDGYEGDDYLGEEMFEVNRTAITGSQFSVLVQIQGFTNIWLMKVRYIAIDSAFPHKLNSFDNVPINYANGPLTNITTSSTSLTFYTNTINFTSQSVANGFTTFTQFSTPLTNNKILLFMTSLYEDGIMDFNPPYNPIDFRVSTSILTPQTYVINFTCLSEVSISRVHFSMIIFDQVDVISSGMYQLVYEKINLPGTGGFIPFPQQFQTNLIIGLIEFQMNKTNTVIHFNLLFSTDASGIYGIDFSPTTPRNNSGYAVRYGYTFFYMKTWLCPNGTYFDLTTNLCEACPLSNCIQCLNSTSCRQCNTATNHVLSPTLQCQACTLPNCLTCESQTNCSVCDNGNSYFLNPVMQVCQLCSIPYCLVCYDLDNCSICDNSNGYFINQSTSVCEFCSIAYCLVCINLTQCQLCDNTNGYFIDTSTQTCQLCTATNCQICATSITCSVCSSGYFLNASTNQCQYSNLCGDGIYMPSQGCDDGNLLDGDGCSMWCTVQSNYTCEANSVSGMLDSVCFYTGQITLQVIYIEKVDNTNQLEILLQIGPKDAKFWQGVDFSQLVTISNLTGFENYSIRMNNGTISIVANYNATIHNMNITVQLDPAQSGRIELSRFPPVSKEFQLVPTDNELAIYYDNSVYEVAKVAEIFAYIVGASSLFLFFLGIFADKLVGVEMMAVIQISHLSLLTLQHLNPVFKVLANIWFVNGFNIFSLSSKGYLLDPYSPRKVKGIYLYSYFIQNYNFTFLLVFIPLILSLFCLFLSLKRLNLQKRKQIRQFAKKCVCQYAFTGLMFSGYIVSVAFALEILYGMKNMDGLVPPLSLVICTLMVTLMITYFVIKIVKPWHFGEFTQKFMIIQNKKNQKLTQKQLKGIEEQQTPKRKISMLHYNCLMIERFAVGSCLVFIMELRFSLLLPILVFIAFVGESVVVRPYRQTKHNIRFACNMAISIIVLVIYLAYSQTNQTNPTVQSPIWIYMPLLICILLLVCIIYSAVFLLKSLISKLCTRPRNQPFNQQQDLQWFSKQNKIQYSAHREKSIQKYRAKIGSQDSRRIKNQFKQIRRNLLKEYTVRDSCLLANGDAKVEDYDGI